MDSSLSFLLKFGEKDHIEEFASGILYCSNAVTFWGIEDKLKIKGQGDILEAGVKTFAQRMAMQENETGEITVIDMPVNAIAHIDPAKHIPVFCMFAVFDDNCEITSEGSLKIKLPAETKATIREHFPNADSVAVISNPEQFIEDVEKSIGHRMEHECVHYFHIDKGLKIENSDQTAMDMEYMKYLMQDTPPKVEKGKTTYSFAAKYAYRVLFCKDVFFEREQEYRLVLPEETIYKSTKYPVKIQESISIHPLDEFLR